MRPDLKPIFEARTKIVQLNRTDYHSISNADGLELKVAECDAVIKNIVDLYKKIESSDIEGMPHSARKVLSAAIRRTQMALQEFHTLDPLKVSRDDVLRMVRHLYDQNYTELTGAIAHATTSRRAIRPSSDAQDDLARVKKAAEEAERTAAAIRATAAQVGVSEHAKVFDAAAEEHSRLKVMWLKASVILLGVSVTVAALLWRIPAGGTMGAGIHVTTQKLFVLGLVSYALVRASRTYQAEAHNQVVNEHRRNALKTFEVFTNAAADNATRDAVLTQATQCIFSHRPSGFGHNESDTPPSSHMLELTRSVVPSGSGRAK